MTLLRRLAPDVQFMRGCEVQDGKRRTDQRGRGGLHDHVILRTGYALDERTIRGLAIQSGYGHSILLANVSPGSSKEAHYVSKYVSKSAGARAAVPWRADVINYETGEITRELIKARYRTWSASRRWGVTMAQLRAEAVIRAQAIAAAAPDVERSALAVLGAVLGAIPLDTDESPPLPS